MTYDPDRDLRAPADVNPNIRPYERERTDISVVLMLSLVAAFLATGFWLYATKHDDTAAIDDRPMATERTTTGAGSQEQPLPNTPTPPTVPSPPRQ